MALVILLTGSSACFLAGEVGVDGEKMAMKCSGVCSRGFYSCGPNRVFWGLIPFFYNVFFFFFGGGEAKKQQS